MGQDDNMNTEQLKSLSDEEFIVEFFDDELSAEKMDELDIRLQEHEFKNLYNNFLESRYKKHPVKTFVDYLPMVIMTALICIGIVLMIVKS